MKSRKHLFCFAILFSFTACGGGGGGGEPPSGDPADFVPDESISADLIGDWLLEAEMTRSTCPNISVGDKSSLDLTVESDSCEISGNEDSDFPVDIECRAGGDKVSVVATVDVSLGSNCRWFAEESTFLELTADRSELTGHVEFNNHLSGACPQEVLDQFGDLDGCIYEADVTGTRAGGSEVSETGGSFLTKTLDAVVPIRQGKYCVH